MTLHPADKKLVDIWKNLVERDGFGINSPRFGWLKENTSYGQLASNVLTC